MRVRMFTYHPPGSAVVPRPLGMFADFQPGRRSIEGSSLLGDLGAPDLGGRSCFGELQSQYHVWQTLLDQYDFVGFERAGRPLFIDPMRQERLLVEFPSVAEMRVQFLVDWRAVAVGVSQAGLQQYDDMRRCFGATEHARIAHWLARLDVVVTQPIIDAAASGRRQALLDPTWAKFARIAERCGVFAESPGCLDGPQPHWPGFNTYLMRTPLFREMISATFEALFAFQAAEPELSRHDVRILAERLVGIYLYAATMRDPLLRVVRAPVLVLVPDPPPAAPPPGFDPAQYLRLNPDVAATGLSAEAHYLTKGWNPFRDWAM